MTTPTMDLVTQLDQDLSSASVELVRARLRWRQKDTPGNRSVVAEWLERIDALLDMHLEAAPPHPCGARAGSCVVS